MIPEHSISSVYKITNELYPGKTKNANYLFFKYWSAQQRPAFTPKAHLP